MKKPASEPQKQTSAPQGRTDPGKGRAIACILAGGSLWGCTGLFNRGLSAAGIHASSIVLIRNLGTMVLLALLFLLTDRSVFRIRLRHFPLFLCTGIVSVLFFTLCYFRAQQLTSLAVAAILLYTAPAFVVILSALCFREKITGKKLAALGIAFLGCLFVTGIGNGGLSLTPIGLLLGLGSGFFYATYTIFSRFALRHYPPFTVTFYTFLVAGLGALVLLDREDMTTLVSSPSLLLLSLGLIIISTVLPYLLYTKGLKDLGDGGKASILASIEPVVAAFVGILAFGEPMGLGVLLGLGCILISVYILK